MAVFSANPPPPPPDALEIKVQPGDAILGPAAMKDFDRASAAPSFLGRLFGFGLRAVVIAGLCVLAWMAGERYSSGHFDLHAPFGLLKFSRTADVEQSTEREAVLSQMRQMEDEIRALKASIDSQDAVRGGQDSQKAQADPAQATTRAAITELVGRVDKLEAEITGKLSQVNEQLATIEKQITVSRPAVAARTPSPAHIRHERLHDAFDPTQHPTAVGAPRPLGAAQQGAAPRP